MDDQKDHFQALGFQRRPWVEPELVQERFLKLTKEFHPDKFHSELEEKKREAEKNYIRINEAHQVLQDPCSRLRHLIELESGSKPGVVDKLPEMVMDLFMEVAGSVKNLDNCIKEKAEVSNPLLKMAAVQKGMSLSEPTQKVLQKIQTYQDSIISEIKRLDADWEGGHKKDIDSLEILYRSLSHTEKWLKQLNEKLFQAQMPD